MEYYITQEDYLRAQREHLGKKGVIVSIVCIAKACFIGVLLSLDGVHETNRFVRNVSLAAVAGVLAACIIGYMRDRSYKKNYASHRTLHRKCVFSFDGATFRFESDSRRFSSPWRDIYGCKIGENVVLIYEARNIMWILPVSTLREHGVYDDLVNVLKRGAHENRGSVESADAPAYPPSQRSPVRE